MAASGYTPVSLYYSNQTGHTPTAGNLVYGELAINIYDGKLYYKDNTNAVKVIAGTGGTGVVAGSNTQIQFNNNGVFGASSSLTWDGTNLSATTLHLTNALTSLYGGTGISSYTAGDMLYYSSGTALTKLPLGTQNYVMTAGASGPQWVAQSSIAAGAAGVNTNVQFNNGGVLGAASTFVYPTTGLGLGTSTPLGKLHVVGGNSNNAIIDNGGQQYTTLSWYNNGTEKAQTYWDQTNTLFVSGTDVSAAYVFKTNGTERMRIAGSSGNVSIGTASTPIKFLVNSTDAIGLPVGDTAQRPTGSTGYIRFNTDIPGFEGYNGTSWLSVGGATISNDTTTASNLYPLFANATTGLATTIYTSNANYLYKPSTGELTAPELVAGNGIVVNNQTVNANYTIPVGYSASSAGPIAVAGGVVVTVSSGSRWVVQ